MLFWTAARSVDGAPSPCRPQDAVEEVEKEHSAARPLLKAAAKAGGWAAAPGATGGEEGRAPRRGWGCLARLAARPLAMRLNAKQLPAGGPLRFLGQTPCTLATRRPPNKTLNPRRQRLGGL